MELLDLMVVATEFQFSTSIELTEGSPIIFIFCELFAAIALVIFVKSGGVVSRTMEFVEIPSQKQTHPKFSDQPQPLKVQLFLL